MYRGVFLNRSIGMKQLSCGVCVRVLMACLFPSFCRAIMNWVLYMKTESIQRMQTPRLFVCLFVHSSLRPSTGMGIYSSRQKTSRRVLSILFSVCSVPPFGVYVLPWNRETHTKEADFRSFNKSFGRLGHFIPPQTILSKCSRVCN